MNPNPTQKPARDPDLVKPGHGPNPLQPRSYASPEDVYEDSTGWDSPFTTFSPGVTRAQWALPDNSVSNSPVSSLQSSGQAATNLTNQIQGGVALNPQAPAAGFNPLPNMQVTVQATGAAIEIKATVTLKSTVASDTVQLAFYRNGNLLGNAFSVTSPATTSTAFLAQIAATDTPPRGMHVYMVYWKAGSGTLSANGVQRLMFVTNLRPN